MDGKDPSRIPVTLAALQKAWLRLPEMRLGQLLIYLTAQEKDPFFVEDTVLEERAMYVAETGEFPRATTVKY